MSIGGVWTVFNLRKIKCSRLRCIDRVPYFSYFFCAYGPEAPKHCIGVGSDRDLT